MKPHFRLHALERLRARILRERRTELARAAEACRTTQEAVDSLRASSARALMEAARPADGASVRLWGDQADALRQGEARARIQLGERREAHERARLAAVEAQQQLRVVEKLRERREEEARLHELRSEERELNDRNAGSFARKMHEAGGRNHG